MKILFATDGSAFSQVAGHLLTRLPWPSARDLTVLSVVDQPTLLSPSAVPTPDEAPHAPDVQPIIDQEVERFMALGWQPRSLVREGRSAREIVAAAEELTTDVIAVGSRGLGGVKRFLLGSVSEQVLTYAPCSVLIARQPEEHGSPSPLRVLLAYDGSPTADAAVDMLTSLALDEHTHILVTTVMTLMTYYRMDILQTTSPSWQAEKQVAHDRLDRIERRLRSMTSNVEVQLREGEDPSQELLDAAEAFNAALIVVGHKGRSGIERLLLGGVATRVVHHAPCSVWVVRACSQYLRATPQPQIENCCRLEQSDQARENGRQ